MHGVTLRTPPKGELFADFHGASIGASPTLDSRDSALGAMGTPSMFAWQQMLPFMMPGMIQAMAAQVAPTQIAQAQVVATHGVPVHAAPNTPANKPLARRAPQSSDPPDYKDKIQNPSIAEFIRLLHDKQPMRGLSGYHQNFELLDYYYIDELARMAEEDLKGSGFQMTAGNAKFLLREAKAEVKRIERTSKRARLE
jgi:hypothetical protein